MVSAVELCNNAVLSSAFGLTPRRETLINADARSRASRIFATAASSAANSVCSAHAASRWAVAREDSQPED